MQELFKNVNLFDLPEGPSEVAVFTANGMLDDCFVVVIREKE